MPAASSRSDGSCSSSRIKGIFNKLKLTNSSSSSSVQVSRPNTIDTNSSYTHASAVSSPAGSNSTVSSRLKSPSSPSSSHSIRSFRSSSTSSLRNSTGRNSYGKCMITLGVGISAKVELYYDKHSGHLYAIKTFKPKESYESKSEYNARCRFEYDIVQRIHHRNVLRSVDFVYGFQTVQMVMEYEPYSMLRLIQMTKPSEEEIMCFFRQVCEGVLHLHTTCHIAHRDLKMENLVIGTDAVVKIIDFGTAFNFGTEHAFAKGAVGTPSLISPEAQNKISYDSEANDVWSLAVLLYSMLHLDFPWKSAVQSDKEYNRLIHNDRAELQDKFPQPLQPIVMEMLQVDESHRPTVLQVVESLKNCIPQHHNCDAKLHRRTTRVCEKKLDSIIATP